MKNNLIKTFFPNLQDDEVKYIRRRISKKCSEYYFLDFLKTTSGDVEDAYKLFNFDERLRVLLFKYLLRFEIQIKNDFIETMVTSTGDVHFWKNQKYFICTKDSFLKLNEKIKNSFKNLNINPKDSDAYAASYVMSFGTFVTFYKESIPSYKAKFIEKYTKDYLQHDYLILYKYLLCIRALRNRCAHGTHIVSNSFVNQLNQFSYLKKAGLNNKEYENFSIFELTLKYLFNNLNCSNEFKKELRKLLEENKDLYSKYGAKQSINPTIIEKLFEK